MTAKKIRGYLHDFQLVQFFGLTTPRCYLCAVVSFATDIAQVVKKAGVYPYQQRFMV